MTEPNPSRALDGHIEILQGFAFGSEHFTLNGGMPLVRIRDLEAGTTATNYAGPFAERYVLRDGDILVGMDGEFRVQTWKGGPALLNQRVCRVAPSDSSTDEGFLFHALKPEIDRVHRQTPQTTVRHLSARGIRSCRVLDVPIGEQRRIAEILDTIDETIQATERLIAKLQLVERGLAADALGEALANAHWRVALGSALVGRESLIQTGPFGSQLHAHEYVPNGIPAFMPQDIRPPNLDTESASKVTPLKAAALARHTLKEGDLLLARRGDLSKCAVVRDGAVDGLCGTGCLLVRPGGSGLNSDWLALCYQSDFVQRQVAARAVGSTMANVSAGLVRDLVVPCPPEDWQSGVVDRLSAARAMIECERDVLGKLVKQRHGLAADLLSGCVRTVAS